MAAKDELGRAGEDRAAAHLIERGWSVLERNWRDREGEIDIIAHTGVDLVFVEVKTRRSAGFGDPLEAVDVGKRARLWRLAQAWCRRSGRRPRGPLRLDVIGIVGADPAGGELTHLEDVPWV